MDNSYPVELGAQTRVLQVLLLLWLHKVLSPVDLEMPTLLSVFGLVVRQAAIGYAHVPSMQC